MFGGTIIIGLVVGAAVALTILAAILKVVVDLRRRSRRQARLDKAFERARMVRRAGSGVQGTPYSLYGESFWFDESRPRQ